MEFRKAMESDIHTIMNIIKQAQDYFKDQGIDQWQNNYPNYETIENDIINKNSYVLLNDTIIIGTVVLSFDGERNYDYIYGGEWKSDYEYAVIHRIAVDSSYKGLGIASTIINNVKEICLEKGVCSIKVDTQKDNLSMQKLLKKNEFEYCGIIYLEDKNERIAFERVLQIETD